MNRFCCVLLLPAAIAGTAFGCGGATTGTDGAGMAGLPADFTGPGVYTVPAVPAAQFPIPSVRIEQEDGGVSIYYDLPSDLAGGQKVRVDLDGAPDGASTIQLSGAIGTSTCTVSPGQLLCHEHLSGLHVDLGSAALPPDGPERAAAQSFITDPIGLLRVTLPM